MSLDQNQRYPCITKWKAKFGTGGLAVVGLTTCTGGLTVPSGATATFAAGSTVTHQGTETHSGTCTYTSTVNLNGTTNFGGTADFSGNVVIGHTGAVSLTVGATTTFSQQVTCSNGITSGSACSFTGNVTLGTATSNIIENGRRVPSFVTRGGGDYTLTTYYQTVRFRGLAANLTLTLGITGLTMGTQMVISNRGANPSSTVILSSSTSGTFGSVAHESCVTIWWTGTTWEVL